MACAAAGDIGLGYWNPSRERAQKHLDNVVRDPIAVLTAVPGPGRPRSRPALFLALAVFPAQARNVSINALLQETCATTIATTASRNGPLRGSQFD